MLCKSKKVVFSTHVSDDWFEPVGAKKLITSAKYFHPEIPFVVFKSKDIQEKLDEFHWDILIAPFCADLAKEYDLVVHFDADSCITDRLDELLKADYEIAGVRNNNDFGRAGSLTYPLEPRGTDPFKYINAGLVASTRPDFWSDWIELNKQELRAMGEQDTLNEIFHSGKYKTKILDPVDSAVYYGTATQFGERCNWESWKWIKLRPDGLYLNDKKVKVLHHAGGHKLPKLGLDMFSQKVQLYLRLIADPPTFNDAKGNVITLQNDNLIKMLFSMQNDFSSILNELNEDNLLAKKAIGKTNLTVINFGANVGLYSLFIASRAKKVYAIEDTKQYATIMADLVKKNNLKNVEFIDYNDEIEADLAIIDEGYLPASMSLNQIINRNIKSFLIRTHNLNIVSELADYNPETSGKLIYIHPRS